MAKKKAAGKKAPKTRKKAAKKAKTVKPRRRAAAGPKRPKRAAVRSRPAKPKPPAYNFGPSFFLTAENDTAPAFEIDATPHAKTVRHYRAEKADVREFEQPDGKILYKIKTRL